MILNNDVVEHIQDEENKIEYLRFKPLEKYGDVDALYTLSSYGVDFRRPSHKKYVKDVEDESLNRLEKSLKIDKNTQTGRNFVGAQRRLILGRTAGI